MRNMDRGYICWLWLNGKNILEISDITGFRVAQICDVLIRDEVMA